MDRHSDVPLRDRKGEIPKLALRFLKTHGARCGLKVSGISPPALAVLAQHDWPGNEPELDWVMERALFRGNSGPVEPEDLPDYLRGGGNRGDWARHLTDMTKREAILETYKTPQRKL